MPQKNIFLLGAGGVMGSCFHENSMHTVIPLYRDDYDILNQSPEKLQVRLIEKGIQKGDYILNCAGAVKQHQFSKHEYTVLNALFPHQLEAISQNLETTLLHMSTDCVFDGNSGDYSETTPTSCSDAYGMSKAMGEPEHSCCFRTSIIGLGSRNNASLLDWAMHSEQNALAGFTNHFWNGLTTLELTKYLDHIIEEDKTWVGTRHIHGESTSKYTLLKNFCEIFALKKKVIAMEVTQKCDRILKTNFEMDYNFPSIKQQLKELKENQKKGIKTERHSNAHEKMNV